MAALAQPRQRFNDEREQQAEIVCQLLLDRIPGRILANVKHFLEPVDTGQQPFQLVAQIFLRETVDQIAQDGRWLLVGRAMVGPHHLHQIAADTTNYTIFQLLAALAQLKARIRRELRALLVDATDAIAEQRQHQRLR
uniref:Uncharacterized protein n=1 Tax=Anopheles melas TaxID=34690 RepID=A0A182UJF1_9DIPT